MSVHQFASIDDMTKDKKEINVGTYGSIYDLGESVLKVNMVELYCGKLNSIREVDCMLRLKDEPNIAKIEKIIIDEQPRWRTKEQKTDTIHFTMPKADCDLMNYSTDSVSKKIKIVRDLIRGLAGVHKHGIAHRDIKPENVLMYGDTPFISDFGFSSIITMQEYQTEGVGTGEFKSPEILLNAVDHGLPSDVWALGQLILEFMSGEVLTKRKRNDTQTQFLIRVLNNLPKPMTSKEKKIFLSFIKSGKNVLAKTKYKGRSFSKRVSEEGLPGKYDLFIEMLESMFNVLPKNRPTIFELYSHPYWKTAGYSDEIETNYKFIALVNLTNLEMRKNVCEMVLGYARERPSWYSTRKMFHAIDLYLRYLEMNESGVIQKSDVEKTYKQIFFACVDIACKMFTTFGEYVPISDFTDIDSDIIEKIVIDYLIQLNFKPYRTTIFEHTQKQIVDVFKYFRFFLESENCIYTLSELDVSIYVYVFVVVTWFPFESL